MLSSDFHVCAMAYIYTHTHINAYTHIIKKQTQKVAGLFEGSKIDLNMAYSKEINANQKGG